MQVQHNRQGLAKNGTNFKHHLIVKQRPYKYGMKDCIHEGAVINCVDDYEMTNHL